MRKHIDFLAIAAAAMLTCGCGVAAKSGIEPSNELYVVASDYAPADGVTDAADLLQKMIDDNPRRTILFPDGTYLLSHPIATPADPMKAVHIKMGNFATLKADKTCWGEGGAILRLGGKCPANDIMTNGSTYGIEGGIIDGDGVADGISIESGRETRIIGTSVKHTRIGIHIMHGANSGSSDSDIRDVNIVGNSSPDAIGVLVESYDNSFTNMRIYAVNTGIWCKTGGNIFRNIHPLYRMSDGHYSESRAFVVEQNNNWFDYCYSDQFAKGFVLNNGVESNFVNCFAWWYNGNVPFQTAIECVGAFDSLVYGLHIGFSDNCQDVKLLSGSFEGKGVIRDSYVNGDRQLSPDDASAQFSK